MKAIVLCGGRGTRLGDLTKATPKPLLMVAGRPFIAHILDRLTRSGVDELVLAVGFHWTQFRDYVGRDWNGVKVDYSIESSALGTGGAIKKAMVEKKITKSLVVNGDTVFDIDISALLSFATAKGKGISIALRQAEDCSRFGKVLINDEAQITAFGEKGCAGPGLINGGIYYVDQDAMRYIDSDQFSFENDILQGCHQPTPVYGMVFNNYFIDIGIPIDFYRAQSELKNLYKS
jgi:D-glycero-alpha-D-manno-heptose 1-phosphate guanylyltransferase